MSGSPARKAALKIVSRVRERQAFAHETADAVLRAATDLDPRDRALATRLAYGMIATAGTLDEALDRFLERPGRVEPRVARRLADRRVGASLRRRRCPRRRERRRRTRSLGSSAGRRARERRAAPARRGVRDLPVGRSRRPTRQRSRVCYGHPLWMTELLIEDLGRSDGRVRPRCRQPAGARLPGATRDRASPIDVLDELDRAGAEPLAGPLDGSIRARAPGQRFRPPDVLAHGARRGLRCRSAVRRRMRCGPSWALRIVDVGAGRGTKTLLLQSLARRAGGNAEIWAVDSHAFKLDLLLQARC